LSEHPHARGQSSQFHTSQSRKKEEIIVSKRLSAWHARRPPSRHGSCPFVAASKRKMSARRPKSTVHISLMSRRGAQKCFSCTPILQHPTLFMAAKRDRLDRTKHHLSVSMFLQLRRLRSAKLTSCNYLQILFTVDHSIYLSLACWCNG